jgi:hypothetical protein
MPVQRKPLRSSGALLTGEVSRISPFRELQPGGRGARLAVTVAAVRFASTAAVGTVGSDGPIKRAGGRGPHAGCEFVIRA